MPLAWYFPRWRQLLVQMVMWIALGATVVLAAILDRHLRLGQIVELSAPITDGPLSFSLPAGWKSWTRQAEGDGSAHVATDSVAGVTRTLIISRRRVPHPIPPAEFILRAESPPGDGGGHEFQGVTIDHWPGQSIHWAAQRGPLDAGGELLFSVCSAVVLPGDEGIMIRLDKARLSPNPRSGPNLHHAPQRRRDRSTGGERHGDHSNRPARLSPVRSASNRTHGGGHYRRGRLDLRRVRARRHSDHSGTPADSLPAGGTGGARAA
jgi:hypothetical protein